MPSVCAYRYLFRHNYTDLTVADVFNGINKPSIKTGYLPYIQYREFSRTGSDTNWVEYLSTGDRYALARLLSQLQSTWPALTALESK